MWNSWWTAHGEKVRIGERSNEGAMRRGEMAMVTVTQRGLSRAKCAGTRGRIGGRTNMSAVLSSIDFFCGDVRPLAVGDVDMSPTDGDLRLGSRSSSKAAGNGLRGLGRFDAGA